MKCLVFMDCDSEPVLFVVNVVSFSSPFDRHLFSIVSLCRNSKD